VYTGGATIVACAARPSVLLDRSSHTADGRIIVSTGHHGNPRLVRRSWRSGTYFWVDHIAALACLVVVGGTASIDGVILQICYSTEIGSENRIHEFTQENKRIRNSETLWLNESNCIIYTFGVIGFWAAVFGGKINFFMIIMSRHAFCNVRFCSV